MVCWSIRRERPIRGALSKYAAGPSSSSHGSFGARTSALACIAAVRSARTHREAQLVFHLLALGDLGCDASEQRRIPRNPERSRQHARAMEFMAMVLAGLALVGTAVVCVEDALGAPLAVVRSALSGR